MKAGGGKAPNGVPLPNLVNQQFGRLTVKKLSTIRQRPAKDRKHRNYYIWECVCTCGNITFKESKSLKDGYALSCGCYHKEVMTKHGKSKLPEYSIYSAMKNRCYTPDNCRWATAKEQANNKRQGNKYKHA